MSDVETPTLWHPTVAGMSAAALRDMATGIDQKHDAAHTRLRGDLVDLENRLQAVERMQHSHALKLAVPPDITALSFSTRTVIAIVVSVVGLAAAQWRLNANLEASVMAMIAQNAKVQEERYLSQKDATDELRKRIEMMRIEFQTFKETTIRNGRR